MFGMSSWLPTATTFGARPIVPTNPNLARITPNAAQAAEAVSSGQAAKQFMQQSGMGNKKIPNFSSSGRQTPFDDFGGTYGIPVGVQVPALQQQLFAPNAGPT